MNPEQRYVLDTGVLVSALLFEHSVPNAAFHRARERGVILLSQATFEELREVLLRKKFDRYVTRERREQFLVAFLKNAVVEPTVEIHACRDPRDDKFLELAVSGEASCLITGDEDLLVLHPFRDIPIIRPADFVLLPNSPAT